MFLMFNSSHCRCFNTVDDIITELSNFGNFSDVWLASLSCKLRSLPVYGDLTLVFDGKVVVVISRVPSLPDS